jgi:DNA-binding NarL/FixJ family response regulator
MIRLFVIEDHLAIIVSGLKRLFYSSRDGIEVTGASESVEEAIKMADPDSFDIFIFDLWLENKLPVQNIKKLIEHFSDKHIIVYTSEESSVWKQRMFREGAMAYVSKKTPRSELKMIIEKVDRGEKHFNIKLEEPNQEQEKKDADIPPLESLTPVQQEIIRLLAKGLKHKEVAGIIKISTSSVEKTLNLLRDRFKVKNNLELISLLSEKGEI